MDNIISAIPHLLASKGGLVMFLIGAIEEVIFIIPSSLIFTAAGAILIDPTASFGSALLTAMSKLAFFGALGVTLGSFAIYGIFYWGGKRFLDNYGHYLDIDWEGVEKIKNKFTRGYADEITTFILRAVPIWPMTLISAVSGLIRIPWKSFGLYTFLGTFFRLIFLGMVGWKFGAAYRFFADRLDMAHFYVTVILLVIIAGATAFFIYVRRKRKQ